MTGHRTKPPDAAALPSPGSTICCAAGSRGSRSTPWSTSRQRWVAACALISKLPEPCSFLTGQMSCRYHPLQPRPYRPAKFLPPPPAPLLHRRQHHRAPPVHPLRRLHIIRRMRLKNVRHELLRIPVVHREPRALHLRSEEHTSELQSLRHL